MRRVTLIAVLAVALAVALVGCADNPLQPKERIVEVPVTNYVTNTSMHVVTNTVHYNHDEFYIVNSSYYDVGGYVCFYFVHVKTNRLVTIYERISITYYPIANNGSNYVIEDCWAKLYDPTSNHMGKYMKVKVEWDEEEYTYSNY